MGKLYDGEWTTLFVSVLVFSKFLSCLCVGIVVGWKGCVVGLVGCLIRVISISAICSVVCMHTNYQCNKLELLYPVKKWQVFKA